MLFNSDKLSELLDNSLEDIRQDAALRVQLLSFYRYIFAEQPCGNCKDKLQGYYAKLKDKGMALIDKKIERDFDFKSNTICVPVAFGGADYYTNANLTNESALKILSKNENRISLFGKKPADWKEQVEAFKAAQEEPAKEAKQDTQEETKPMTAKELIKAAKQEEDLAKLNEMLEDEESDKARVSVLTAIEKQIEKLSA